MSPIAQPESRAAARRSERGLTLIEVLIAVTLVSLLSVGILFAIRVGLNAMGRSNARLNENRRVAGAYRVLVQQIEGLIPVIALHRGGQGGDQRIPFFEGQSRSMRFVSAYSLQEASRGMPRILEFQVTAAAPGKGIRLVVNEIPYTGPISAGQMIVGLEPAPGGGVGLPRFGPIQVTPRSFVLGDELATCQFSYLEAARFPDPERWRTDWVRSNQWPLAIRIDMRPLHPDPARLRPLTVTAPIRVNRISDQTYADS